MGQQNAEKVQNFANYSEQHQEIILVILWQTLHLPTFLSQTYLVCAFMQGYFSNKAVQSLVNKPAVMYRAPG